MSKIVINTTDQESITGIIRVDKLDDAEEIIERKFSGGLCVSDLVKQFSKGKYTLGTLEINLDFDENGELVQIEFYS